MTNRKLFWALPIMAIAAAIYVLATSGPEEPVLIEPAPQAIVEAPPEAPPPLLEPEPEPPGQPIEQKRTRSRVNGVKSRGKSAVGPNAQFVMAEDQPRPQLSDGQFYAALEDWKGVRTCLAETPGGATDSGAIRLRFKIAPNGEVKRTVAYDTQGSNAARIRGCVERYALGLRFPSFPGKEEIEKDATFVF